MSKSSFSRSSPAPPARHVMSSPASVENSFFLQPSSESERSQRLPCGARVSDLSFTNLLKARQFSCAEHAYPIVFLILAGSLLCIVSSTPVPLTLPETIGYIRQSFENSA